MPRGSATTAKYSAGLPCACHRIVMVPGETAYVKTHRRTSKRTGATTVRKYLVCKVRWKEITVAGLARKGRAPAPVGAAERRKPGPKPKPRGEDEQQQIHWAAVYGCAVQRESQSTWRAMLVVYDGKRAQPERRIGRAKYATSAEARRAAEAWRAREAA